MQIGGQVRVSRSIPACAGEPVRDGDGVVNGKVYPRVCGGTPPAAAAGLALAGLSPRVRGNPDRAGRYGDGRRSIPACAGEPCMRTEGVGRVRVYPRVCGGTYME